MLLLTIFLEREGARINKYSPRFWDVTKKLVPLLAPPLLVCLSSAIVVVKVWMPTYRICCSDEWVLLMCFILVFLCLSLVSVMWFW